MCLAPPDSAENVAIERLSYHSVRFAESVVPACSRRLCRRVGLVSDGLRSAAWHVPEQEMRICIPPRRGVRLPDTCTMRRNCPRWIPCTDRWGAAVCMSFRTGDTLWAS